MNKMDQFLPFLYIAKRYIVLQTIYSHILGLLSLKLSGCRETLTT